MSKPSKDFNISDACRFYPILEGFNRAKIYLNTFGSKYKVKKSNFKTPNIYIGKLTDTLCFNNCFKMQLTSSL